MDDPGSVSSDHVDNDHEHSSAAVGSPRLSGAPADVERAPRIRHLRSHGRTLGDTLQAEHRHWSGRLRQLIDEFGEGTVPGFHRYLQRVLGEEDAPTEPALRGYLRTESRSPSAQTFLSIALVTGCNPYWLAFGFEPRQWPSEVRPFHPVAAGERPIRTAQSARLQHLRSQGRTLGEMLPAERGAWSSRFQQLIEEFGDGVVAGFHRYLQSMLGLESVPTQPTLHSYLRKEPSSPSAQTFLSIALVTGCNPYWLAFGFEPRQWSPENLLLRSQTDGTSEASVERSEDPPGATMIPVIQVSRGRLVETGEPDFIILRRYLPSGPRVQEAVTNGRLRMLRLPRDYMREEEGAARATNLWLVDMAGAGHAEGQKEAAPGLSLRHLTQALRLSAGDYLVRLGAPFEAPVLLALVEIDPSPAFELLTCVLKQLYLSPDLKQMSQAEREALSDAPAAEEFYLELRHRPVGLAAASGTLAPSFGAPQEVRVALEEVGATRVLAQGMGPLSR